MNLPALVLTALLVTAADTPVDNENAIVASGPKEGTMLTIFKATRVANGTCIHCAMT